MSDDKKTLTPWGLTSNDELIPLLFEKLDQLATAQAEIKSKLEIHIATEAEWQANMEKNLTTHLDEHKAMTSVWRKGAVGALFMLVGSLIVWAASVIYHRPPTP